jgi:hypothetical protein
LGSIGGALGEIEEPSHLKAIFMTVIKRTGKLSPNNQLLLEVSAMAAGLVVKRYKDKIVLSRPPKKVKTKRRPTPLQKDRREIMKEAVFFARRINEDPIKKAAWKKRAKGYTNVYQAAVAFYMKNGEKKAWSLI